MADNLLVNGDFMGDQVVWQGKSTVRLPEGWPLFAYNPEGHMPECYVMDMGAPQNIGRIWKVFTSYARHEYALGQRVRVPVGAMLRFGAQVWAWSSTKDDPMRSEDGGSYHHRIGIDPVGGTDWRSPDIIWDYPRLRCKEMDSPFFHTLGATAEAGVVTVWLHGEHEWALKHGDAYWFTATLEMLGAPGPGPDPQVEARLAALEANQRAIIAYLSSWKGIA